MRLSLLLCVFLCLSAEAKSDTRAISADVKIGNETGTIVYEQTTEESSDGNLTDAGAGGVALAQAIAIESRNIDVSVEVFAPEDEINSVLPALNSEHVHRHGIPRQLAQYFSEYWNYAKAPATKTTLVVGSGFIAMREMIAHQVVIFKNVPPEFALRYYFCTALFAMNLYVFPELYNNVFNFRDPQPFKRFFRQFSYEFFMQTTQWWALGANNHYTQVLGNVALAMMTKHLLRARRNRLVGARTYLFTALSAITDPVTTYLKGMEDTGHVPSLLNLHVYDIRYTTVATIFFTAAVNQTMRFFPDPSLRVLEWIEKWILSPTQVLKRVKSGICNLILGGAKSESWHNR